MERKCSKEVVCMLAFAMYDTSFVAFYLRASCAFRKAGEKLASDTYSQAYTTRFNSDLTQQSAECP